MFWFGLNVTVFTTLDSVGRSSDRIAIGYRAGAAALGYYQNALFVYENLLDIFVAPLHNVAVPALSKLRNDARELRKAWAKALSTLAFFAMPAFGLLAVTSRDLIVLLLGSKWSNSGILLSVLALRGIPHTIERTAGWLHVTAGRTDRWMRWGLLLVATHLIALLAGLPFGPAGVVTAYVVLMFMLAMPAISYAGRPLGIGVTDLLQAIWRPLVGTLTSVIVCFGLRYAIAAQMPVASRIVVLGTTFATLYCALVVGLFRTRTPVRTSLSLCGDFLPSGLADYVKSAPFLQPQSGRV